jgi:hypothetical protein
VTALLTFLCRLVGGTVTDVSTEDAALELMERPVTFRWRPQVVECSQAHANRP